jgi:hypothetical protein
MNGLQLMLLLFHTPFAVPKSFRMSAIESKPAKFLFKMIAEH